jgi:hypothetical protein
MRRILAVFTLVIIVFGSGNLTGEAHADGSFTGTDRLTPRPETVAQIGELRLVATFQVPAADVGCLATFTVHAVNGDSVHQANYGRIVTNGDQADILNTETEPNIDRTRLTDRTLTLGETISLYNIIGPWSDGDTTRTGYVGTSVEYRTGYTCQTDDTTTTSTISSSTSTTPPSTTSTLPPSSSTTTPTLTTTTTLPVPPTTAPTPPTTIVIVDEPPGTVTVPPVTITELPFTGPSHLEILAGFAVAAMASGTVVLYLARSRGRHEA